MTGIMEHLFSAPAWLVLLVVFALPALESSVFLGFVVPGEIAVLLGGVIASQGHVPIAAVLTAGIGGAIAGDAVGYLVGRRWGRRVLTSTLGRFVKPEHLDRATQALATRGGTAVMLGRFTVALRVLVPGLAGMAAMPYRRFAIFNVAGAVAWGGAMVVAGYLAGNSWPVVQHVVSTAGLGATIAVLVALAGAWIVRHDRRRRNRIRVRQIAATRPGADPCDACRCAAST